MSLTAKQLEERRNYIGGSDVGAILGYNKFESALDVFYAKIEGKESVSNTHTYWGNVLEPTIRNEFNSLLMHYENMKIAEPNTTKHHKDYDFLAGNVDGIIYKKHPSGHKNKVESPDGTIKYDVKLGDIEQGDIVTAYPDLTEHAILEIKTVSTYARKFWGEENHDLECLQYRVEADKSSGLKADHGEVPPSYYYQCAFYMAIYDVDLTYLAVYFGNDMPFKVYKIERDLELEELMIKKLVDFWQNNVLKGIPPAPHNLADIIKLYPHGTPDKTIIATNEIVGKSCQYKDAKIREKEAKEEAKEIQGELKFFMGNAEILFDMAGNKLQKWSRFDTTKFQVKTLQEKEPNTYKKYLKTITSSRFT